MKSLLHRLGGRTLLAVLLFLFLFFSVVSSPAQDDPAGSAAAEPDAAAAADDPAAAFESANAEWKAALEEIRAIQIEFQTASPAEQPAMRAHYAELLPQVRDKADALIVAAEKAFAAAPSVNQEIENLLTLVAPDLEDHDRYEDAYRISKLLVDHGVDLSESPQFFLFAGIAAYETAHYDDAEKYFQAAEENGVFANENVDGASDQVRTLLARAAQLQQLIPEARQKWQEEQAIRQAEAAANDLPRVRIETTEGDIVVELFENEAPNTVANFISLVEQGFYDGTPFHRVLAAFMAQGGDPTGTGTGGPGYKIACECYQDSARNHFRGSLSMAHAGRDTGGSQFFLTFVRTEQLDGLHTVFGRVIEGMDVLSRLQRIDPEKPGNRDPDQIVKASVVRKRDHEYEPTKLP